MKNRITGSNYCDPAGNCARLSILGDLDERKVVVQLYISGITFTALNMDREFDASDFPVALDMYNYATDYFRKGE